MFSVTPRCSFAPRRGRALRASGHATRARPESRVSAAMSAALVRLLLFASAGAEKEKRHPRTPFVCPPCLRVLAISPGNAPHVFLLRGCSGVSSRFPKLLPRFLRGVKVKIAGGARNNYFTTPLRSSAIFGPSAALPASFGRRQMTNEALTRGAPAPKHPRLEVIVPTLLKGCYLGQLQPLRGPPIWFEVRVYCLKKYKKSAAILPGSA